MTPLAPRTCLAALCVVLASVPAGLRAEDRAADQVLRYDRPAAQWMTGALPVGNGAMGAMVHGGTDWERIQFNEKSLWNGDERRSNSYQAFGDLFLRFDAAGPVGSYERRLDLGQAVQTTSYEQGGVRFTREVIASHPAQVVLVRLTADRPGALAGRLWLSDMHGGDVLADGRRLTASGVLNNGLTYESQVLAVADGGTVGAVLENGFDNRPVARRAPGPAVLDGTADAYLAAGNARREPNPYFDTSDADPSGRPLVLGGAWFDRGVNFRAPGDLAFDLGGRYRWVSFTSSLGKGQALQVVADGKTVGEVAAPGGYVCFPIPEAKELRIASKNNAFLSLGHLRVSPATAEPPPDPGIVRPVSAERPAGRTDPLPPASLRFAGCTAITLVLGAATAYVPDRARGWRGPHPHEALTRRVDAAAARPWADLRAEHVRDHGALYDACRIDLGAPPAEVAALTTDRRLERYARGEADPGLEALLFRYGRYLLIASSRPGSLPANLQGVWNEVNTPPWTCDYHADINVEMNYWPADVTGLSECFQPLSDWMLASLPVWTEATRAAFKVPGWTIRGHNGTQGGFGSQWYQACNAWLCRNLWDHYAFTQDRAYLRRVYPLLRQAAEFWDVQLIERSDGVLLTPVTYSPEHGPREEGVSFAQQLVWDLYGNTATAAGILGIDEAFAARLRERRAKLLGPQVGRWGQLQEWKGDIDDPNSRHRHTSHLVAVYPGEQITLDGTPAFAQAAAVSLIARGEESTGWAQAWRICLWARLREPGRAYGYVRRQLRLVTTDRIQGDAGGGVYQNLLNCCPPFQIDGNLGYTAGIAEMLVQSHLGTIDLLPALPKAWATGSVEGLRLRGGGILRMAWRDGKVTEVAITTPEPGTVRIRAGGEVRTLATSAGR